MDERKIYSWPMRHLPRWRPNRSALNRRTTNVVLPLPRHQRVPFLFTKEPRPIDYPVAAWDTRVGNFNLNWPSSSR